MHRLQLGRLEADIATHTPAASLGGDDTTDNGSSGDSQTSRDNPTSLGATTEVAGWEITVTATNPDATDEILASDEFIDPPEDGEVFYTIEISATYVGDGENESRSVFESLNWGAVGDSAVAYDEFNDTCTFFGLPDELDSSAEVFEGGTVSGNICFSVSEDDADSLELYADPFGFNQGGREWFALR